MSKGIENSRVIKVMALLAEKWPVFSIYEGRRRPLKIGIHQEIAAALGDSVNRGELHAALHRYTRTWSISPECGKARPASILPARLPASSRPGRRRWRRRRNPSGGVRAQPPRRRPPSRGRRPRRRFRWRR